MGTDGCEVFNYFDRNILVVRARARNSVSLEWSHFPSLYVVIAEEGSEPVIVRGASPFASVVPYLQVNDQLRGGSLCGSVLSCHFVIWWRRLARHGVMFLTGTSKGRVFRWPGELLLSINDATKHKRIDT